MRLIIKPAGLAVISVSILGLAGLALARQGAHSGTSTAQASTPDTTAPQTGATTTTVGQSPSPEVTSTSVAIPTGKSDKGGPVVSREDELMAAPKLASDEWKAIEPKSGSDIRVFPCSLPQFPKLRRVDISVAPQNPWDIQLRQSSKGEIPLGAHVHVRLWARSKDGCPITIACEHNDAPYEKLATETITLSPEWKQYDIEWTSDRDAPANWSQISLQLGAKKGEIDLAGASMIASTSAAK